MAGILSRIFGSDNAVKKGFDLVDEAFHTSQEKAEDSIKATNAKINLLKAYEAFKLVQRIIAMSYCLPYTAAWFITFICSFWMDVSKQLEIITNGDIALANVVILGFYFGGGFAEGIITKYTGVKRVSK